MPARDDVMHVYNFIPSAYHAFEAIELRGVGSGCDPIVCAAEVWITISGYILSVAVATFCAKSCSISARLAAILCRGEAIRFYIECFSAILTGGLRASAFSKLRYLLKRPGSRLIGACAGTVVVIQFSLGRLAVESLAALRAFHLRKSALLPSRRALFRAVNFAKLASLGSTWESLESLAARCADVGRHIFSRGMR